MRLVTRPDPRPPARVSRPAAPEPAPAPPVLAPVRPRPAPRPTKAKKEPPAHVTLTRQETAVLLRLAEGESSQEIAEALTLSKRTIDFHLANIYAKFGVQNRLQAVLRAGRLGLLTEEQTDDPLT